MWVSSGNYPYNTSQHMWAMNIDEQWTRVLCVVCGMLIAVGAHSKCSATRDLPFNVVKASVRKFCSIRHLNSYLMANVRPTPPPTMLIDDAHRLLLNHPQPRKLRSHSDRHQETHKFNGFIDRVGCISVLSDAQLLKTAKHGQWPIYAQTIFNQAKATYCRTLLRYEHCKL